MDNSFKVYYSIINNLKKSSEVILFSFIYSFYENGQKCTFSLNQLADICNLSKSTVQRTIKALQLQNMISVKYNINEEYIGNNTYEVTKDAIKKVSIGEGKMNGYKQCFLCGRNGNGDRLERHHIFGAANRDKSEKYGLVVWLCGERCHRLGRLSVHQNAEVMEYLHKYGQRKFMEEQNMTAEQFREIFHANYL